MIAGHMRTRRAYRTFPLLAAATAAALTLGFGVTTHIADAAQAGTATIRVEVTESGRPVAGATVSGADPKPVTTDASGVATLTISLPVTSQASASPVLMIRIVATKDGYQPAKGSVQVTASGTQTVHLILEPPITNDGTIVTSTRTNRRVDDQAVPVAMLVRDRIDARTTTLRCVLFD